ncbi:hypothetical protein M569_01066, partial [Genlisea aurea]
LIVLLFQGFITALDSARCASTSSADVSSSSNVEFVNAEGNFSVPDLNCRGSTAAKESGDDSETEMFCVKRRPSAKRMARRMYIYIYMINFSANMN